jgi:multiple sugar transport system ATP-binding protein
MADVVLENVSKTFATRQNSVRALTDFSLAVRDGEFLVLLGPSGAGKTTVLRLIAGLEKVSSGTISMDGQMMNEVAPAERDIAMVFQSAALYPHMSVRENIGFPLRLRKFPKSEIAQRVEAAAQTLGLTQLLDRKPNTLSGGERQRVALGRAMVRKPKLFLFDEPLSNLDPATRSQLRAEILRLHQQLSATMIYVTHDQLEAMTMGDRIVVMKEGAIQQIGGPMELYDQPANLFVAGFIGSPPMNFFRGKLIERDGVIACALGLGNAEMVIALPKNHEAALHPHLDGQVVLGVRPEDLRLATGGENSFAATVELVERTGPETFVHSRAGSSKVLLRLGGEVELSPGAEIRVAPYLEKAHFFDEGSARRIG